LIIVLTMVATAKIRRPMGGHRHPVARSATGLPAHRRDRSGHFAGRPEQVVDQRVDGTFHVGPGAAGKAELTRWRVFPSRPTTWPSLSCCAIRDWRRRFHESIGDLAFDTQMIARHFAPRSHRFRIA